MTSPYRSASPPERILRPLEPEDEMRLLDTSWRLYPRGAERRSLYVLTILGVACLALVPFTPVAAIMMALWWLTPVVATLAARRSFRLELARLRELGYDVSEFEQKPRVAVEPRIRVHAPSEEQSVDAESAVLADRAATSDEAGTSRLHR